MAKAELQKAVEKVIENKIKIVSITKNVVKWRFVDKGDNKTYGLRQYTMVANQSAASVAKELGSIARRM